MDINLNQIRELADLALEKNLAELTVEDGDRCVTIKLPVAAQTVYTANPPVAAPQLAPVTASSAPAAETASEDQYYKITAPMVGTFYAAPSPGAPAFVQEGQAISKGQTVCIIEAMKLMNELEAEVSGKVVRILVENGKPVEFGQPLMLVDTQG